MKCRKKWDLEFLKTQLNASFMQTEYRDHRKNILIDSAISKMSEHYANAIIYNNQKKAETEIRKKNDKIDELHKEINKIYTEISVIRSNPELLLKKSSEERRKFVMPCQSNGCRGMLSSSYKCDLCEKYTCAQCFAAIIGEKADHACKQDDIDTADELRRNSKPCPQCGARISKIDGCDQMWCVECKTAFSWNRGTIETGNVHNPHFFQWMRTNGGQMGGGACGRDNNRDAIVSIKDTTSAFARFSNICANYVHNYEKKAKVFESHHELALTTFASFKKINKKFYSTINDVENYFFKFYRFINHVDGVDLRHIRTAIQVREDDNVLFYKYILNECDKDVLADFLIKRDVLNVKDIAYRDILDAFVIAGRQIIDEFNKEFSEVLSRSVKEKIGTLWTMVSRESPSRLNTTQIDIHNNLFFFVYETVELYIHNVEIFETGQQKVLDIINKYYRIIDNYTNYTNLEIMRYFVLYNIRRQAVVWNHSHGAEETLRFDTKSEIVQKMKEYSEKIEKESVANTWV
jgi:hypothetical protein